jgi:hypothetical protein
MAKEQKPSISRIVLFQTEEGESLPGIITKVNESGTVNLRLFTNNEQNQFAPLLVNVEHGKKEKQWSWPSKDGE